MEINTNTLSHYFIFIALQGSKDSRVANDTRGFLSNRISSGGSRMRTKNSAKV